MQVTYKHHVLSYPHQLCEVGIIALILQRKKLQLRKVSSLSKAA